MDKEQRTGGLVYARVMGKTAGMLLKTREVRHEGTISGNSHNTWKCYGKVMSGFIMMRLYRETINKKVFCLLQI